MNFRVSIALVFLLATLGTSGAGAQIHCSELPPLTPEATFPRCSPQELAVAGFPDHMHSFAWVGWEVLTDAQGVPYGLGTLCERGKLLPNENVIIEPDRKSYRQFVVQHNPDFMDCDMLLFLEFMDWAYHDVSALLGLSATDTLTLVNPDDADQYREMTGHGIWRLYALAGDQCILEPFPVLLARTLAGHAVFMIAADWILQEAIEAELPPWLHQGILEYISEDGMHLVSYVAEFRQAGPVLLAPPLIDALLNRGIDTDENKDREMFRRASYSSFLMVWQLVEHEGGLVALREFLSLAAAGMDLDQAALQVYGMDLGQLAAYLDPVKLGEPLPLDIVRPMPHVQP